jgi:hypothetical protein
VSRPETGPAETGPAAAWGDRVDATDWGAVRADLENYGCGLTGALLDPGESAAIAALYGDDARFRATVDLARYRFGAGEYRYFAEPFPAAVAGLKQALYPRLPPVRSWMSRLRHRPPRHPVTAGPRRRPVLSRA